MAFLNAACYVFAIAGYKNDQQAAQVGSANQNASDFSALGKMKDNNARLAAIVNTTRRQCDAGGLFLDGDDEERDRVEIAIYGRFNSNGVDVSPMHYWIECNGYIFEKWTDHELVSEKATDGSRVKPQSLVNVDRGTYTVGHCVSYLTEYQKSNILDRLPEVYSRLGFRTRKRRRG